MINTKWDEISWIETKETIENLHSCICNNIQIVN